MVTLPMISTVPDRFRAWNVVQVGGNGIVRGADIIASLRQGRFVASTGVTVSRIGVSEDGRTILVESDARVLRWFYRFLAGAPF